MFGEEDDPGPFEDKAVTWDPPTGSPDGRRGIQMRGECVSARSVFIKLTQGGATYRPGFSPYNPQAMEQIDNLLNQEDVQQIFGLILVVVWILLTVLVLIPALMKKLRK